MPVQKFLWHWKFTMADVVATTLFSQYGVPRYILTDSGESFTIQSMKHLERLFNVKQLTTSKFR